MAGLNGGRSIVKFAARITITNMSGERGTYASIVVHSRHTNGLIAIRLYRQPNHDCVSLK